MIFLIWGAIAALAAAAGLGLQRCKSIKVYAWVLAGSFVLVGYLGWLTLPTLNLHFYPLYFFVAISLIAGLFVGGAMRSDSVEDDINYRYHRVSRRVIRSPLGPWWAWAAGVPVALILLWIFTTSAIVHSSSYRALLGQPKAAGTFSADVAAIDTQRLRVVGSEFATRQADTMLGERQGLGSQVTIGEMNISQINGCFAVRQAGSNQTTRQCFEHELVWVAPLVHSGFFRWLANDVTHHYVIVSASDPSRRFLVEEVNGQRLTLRYHNSGAYFGDYLQRHLRNNGYLTDGLTDHNFELDDQGRPWWVVVRYVRRIGMSGDDPVGVLTVNPATGEIHEYRIDNMPAWVDRAQPEDMALQQFDRWGAYVHGWWNATFGSKRDVVQTSTDDLHLVEGRDGRTYWYTGITSVGRDQATTGFVLIDTRTRETRMYRIPGLIEETAKQNAQNAPYARERSYVAGEPILYNMGGYPTYLMTLSGDDHVPRMYAFASVQYMQGVGVGDTVDTALANYRAALQNVRRQQLGQRAFPRETAEAPIGRIVRDGNAWMFLLPEQSGAEFLAPNNLSPELKYTQEGDRVRLTYERTPESRTRNVVAFENLEVDLTE